jgi:hypothetical protein
MSCFKSNKTLYDCDAATVLLSIYIYLVFVGEGFLPLVPSHCPHLRELRLISCDNLRFKYVRELVDAASGLEVSTSRGVFRKRQLGNS